MGNHRANATGRILTAILVPAALATAVAMIVLWPGRVARAPAPDGVRTLGTVTAVDERTCPPDAPGARPPCGTATVRITGGAAPVVDLPQGPGAPRLRPGDGVVLLRQPDGTYTVTDHQRATGLIWLLALAALVVLVFGRRSGLTSLAGLAISFGVLLLFVIPDVLDGSPPLLVAVVGASAIMFAALYLTHGVTVHTSVAIAGTLGSLVLTGVLGLAFTAALHLTGIAGDDDSYLAATRANLDMRGLLLAGVVIGALGVLDDVTVTQAVTVAELAGGATSRRDLYRAASRVGRAHVASAVNTIVLAYAGASLPPFLLIVTSGQPAGELLTGPFLAQENMRAAVGTIGLVAAVPITTGLAVLVAGLPAATPR